MAVCPHCKRAYRPFWDDCPHCLTTIRWAQRVDGKNVPREAFQAWVAAGRPMGNANPQRRDVSALVRYGGPTYYMGTVDAQTQKGSKREPKVQVEPTADELMEAAAKLLEKGNQ